MNTTEGGEHRVRFDFEIDFSNGGGLQGQGFRLDIEGADIADDDLAGLIVRDLGLLMVSKVRVLNKEIIRERHKRPARVAQTAPGAERTRIDLSHTVEDGMITYRGLPAPAISDHLGREQSRPRYSPGTEFQIGQINMCANTGTYVDSPFHRYADGADLAALPLDNLAELEGVMIDVTGGETRTIDRAHLLPYDVRGKAVLVHTGWDRHWRTDAYFEGHPFLTEDAARFLASEGAVLVGIDSVNIDDTTDGNRPVHSTLSGGRHPDL